MENERKKRKKYSPEFKAEAAKLVNSGERSQAEAARNLGISTSTINKWCREAQGLTAKANTEAPQEDLAAKCKKLESENRRLKLEQEILKKATAFFAKDHM